MASANMDRMDRSSFLTFLAIGSGVLLLRFAYDQMETRDLMWLLAPSAWGVQMATGARQMITDAGITFPELAIVLDRSCAGGHFAIVFAGFLLWLLRLKLRADGRGLLLVCGVLVVAVPVTILANVWRVLLSLFAERIDPSHLIGSTVTMHLVIGAVIQLGLLSLAHVILRHRTQRSIRTA